MLLGRAKFDVNRFNESPRAGEKADFRLLSKVNTGSLQILPVKKNVMKINIPFFSND